MKDVEDVTFSLRNAKSKEDRLVVARRISELIRSRL